MARRGSGAPGSRRSVSNPAWIRAVIYLRNTHPTRRTLVPIAPGWARIVLPQACATVPAAVLASRHVQQALAEQRLCVVTEVTASADARNALALRTDLALAIAQAEAREFDRLIAQQAQERGEVEAPRRHFFWSAERIEGLRQRIAAGATMRQLAAEHGVTRQAMDYLCRRHGLLPGDYKPRSPVDRKRRADEWPAGLIVRLKARWAEGATSAAIAAELGVTPGAVTAKATRLGLPRRYKPRSDRRPVVPA